MRLFHGRNKSYINIQHQSFTYTNIRGFSYLSGKTMTSGKKLVGLTNSQGWETGIRRTFTIAPADAWETLFTQPVLGYWLDSNAGLPFEKSDTYTTSSGITIRVTSVTTGKVIRIKWQQAPDTDASTLQIRVIPAREKTVIAFHHEWLKNEEERIKMNDYWKGVLDKIEAYLQR